MFDNNDANDDDDSTDSETEYVVKVDGDVHGVYDTEDAAQASASDLSWKSPRASVTVEERAVEGEEDDPDGYTVVDNEGDEWGTFSDLTQAEHEADRRVEEHPEYAPYEVQTIDDKGDLITLYTADTEVGVPDDVEMPTGSFSEPKEIRPEDVPGVRTAGYDFIQPDEAAPSASPERDYEVEKWSLGRHSTAPDEVKDDLSMWLGTLDDEVDDDLQNILQEAAKMVEGAGVHDFECAVCGLNHGHGDDKHDIRPTFSVRDEFAEGMEFVPFCHCGVNEFAMLMDFYGYITAPVFEDAHEKFPAVERADTEDVQAMLRAFSRGDDPREAAREAGFSAESRGECRTFLKRVDKIKSAASSAPISSETRTRIDELREDIERAVDE